MEARIEIARGTESRLLESFRLFNSARELVTDHLADGGRSLGREDSRLANQAFIKAKGNVLFHKV